MEDRRLLSIGPFPVPLEPVEPLGSLIYESSVAAEIAASGETDSFTIDLDDGQTVTLVVDPDATLQPTIGLLDPGDVSIGSATAGAGGEDAVLQTVTTNGAGTYTITVGGQSDSTGQYTLQLILNAAVEHESYGGPANDGPASFQDIDGSFITLGDGSAQRGAVLGSLPPAADAVIASEDFESGSLGGAWTTWSSQPEGRIQVTGDHGTGGGSFALLMDRDPAGDYNLNEAIWRVDLWGLSSVTLSFSHAEFGDFRHGLPTYFTGSRNGDGVAISDDGTRWRTIFVTPNQADGEWVSYTIDLAAEAAKDRMTLGREFQIKFQQYDSLPLEGRGVGYDDIAITVPDPYEDWYRFTLRDGQSATLALTEVTPGDGTLELYDGNANLLATGIAAANVAHVIDDFVDATTDGSPDRYFARVTSILEDRYSLVVTRGADFDVEPNGGPPPAAQDVTASGRLLGYLGPVEGEEPVEHKFTASDADAGDNFGGAVSISGDTAIVGAPSDDDRTGAACVFWLDGSRWVELQKLTASDRETNDRFGASVSISGDTAIVGAPGNDDAGEWSGSAYIFQYDGNQWQERQKLTASDAEGYDNFAGSVSISGDTVIIGAIGDADGGDHSGSAYVFAYDGNQWVEKARLRASDAGEGDYFGQSVSISGDTAVVGASFYNNSEDKAGSAYVFHFDGSAWIEQQKLVLPEEDADRSFGHSVSVSGGMMIVGAYGDDEHGEDYGAAYVFQFDGNQWHQQQKLTAADADAYDRFGDSVSVSGDTAIIGAYSDDGTGWASGAAYVFRYDGSQWVEHMKLTASDAGVYDFFGGSVSISGNNAITGASQDDDDGDSSGSAYVFNLSPLDDYAVGVQVGDSLVVSTATPGDGAGEPVNTFDPVVELFDPSGTLVADDDNSAPDGRNALLMHTAATTGAYTVRVQGAGDTIGEYALSISGHTGTPPAFEVVAMDPAEGIRLSSVPGLITVDLNHALLLSTLDASDLTIDGTPAVAVTAIEGDTLIFEPPALDDGIHQLAIPGGALLDLQGTPVEPFADSFEIDTTPPRVIASSLREGYVVATGPLFFAARFDEELSVPSGDQGGVELVGLLSGVHVPNGFNYDPVSSTLTVEFSDLPDDIFTLTLRDYWFKDLLYHRLDGEPEPLSTVPSGDGVAGGDFVVNFRVEAAPAPFPVPLEPKSPQGSLIYDGSTIAVIAVSDDTDSFTIDLDPNQSITAVVDPDATLRPTVEVSGPDGSLLGSATAGAAGADAVVQTVPTAGAGTYTVTIGGAAGTTGVYTLQLILNGAVELEEHDGPANGDAASAQDLDPSFIPLGDGSAQRGAVLGTMPSPLGVVIDSEDFESGTLDDQWRTDSSPSPWGSVGMRYGAGDSSYALSLSTGRRAGVFAEAIWSVDLSEVPFPALSFSERAWSSGYWDAIGGDSTTQQLVDGVAISDDGINWHPVWLATWTYSQTQQWTQHTIDLTTEAAAAGMTLGTNFRIKFRFAAPHYQYSTRRGRFYDDIMITTPAMPMGDWYRFTLDDGQTASLALTTASPSGAMFELYDDSQDLLASSAAAAYVDQAIKNFVDPTNDGSPDTYYVRVVGISQDYNLVITRGADFDTERNDGPPPVPQDITAGGVVLGHAGYLSGTSTTEQQKLTASDADRPDYFGSSLSVDGDTAIVGAYGDDDAGWDSGAAYVFRYDGVRWTEQQKLTPSDAGSGDYFGYSVSVDGDTAIVGAYKDGDAGGNSGSAYVFRYDGSQWVEQQKLTASDAAGGDDFGISVSIDGDTAIVGASNDDDAGVRSGSAYIFRYDGSQWIEQEKLTASDAAGGEYFGISVSIDGDTTVIGAYRANGAGSASGAAYVFRNDGSQWIEWQKLIASDASALDYFGHSVSISRAVAIVGAYGDDDAGSESGSAYVFGFDGDQWAEQQKLTASGAAARDYFGRSVSIGGDVAVVGAYGDDDAGEESGAAYVFRLYGGQWYPQQKFTASDAAAYDRFGKSVSVNGDTAIVGAYLDDDAGTDSGSAYVFELSPPHDLYALAAQAGDELTMATATPADGPGAFANVLDPAVEVYDPNGMLVAADDNSAPDGRNALLTYTVQIGGTYTVRVLAPLIHGEYVLQVSGQTGAPAPFEVAATDPADGVALQLAPGHMTVDFNDSVRLTTLDASDLSVDGVPATAVTVLDGNTAVFDLPAMADGLRRLAIAAGAILDVQGTPIEAFATSLTLHTAPPRVIATSLLPGDVVPTGGLVYTARFDKELDASNLDPADAKLLGQSTGTYAPVTLNYDPVESTLTLEFADLPEDTYTLKLLSGAGRFEDLVGRDLDGEPDPTTTVPSGDGTTGGDFFVDFSADRISVAANPFTRLRPLGSLMSKSGGNLGLFNFTGDEDEFRFHAQAGQVLSAVAYPDDPGATLSIEIPQLSGPAVAAGPGQPAILPPAAVAADGTYAVRISGDMPGTYRLEIGKNLAAEIVDTGDGSRLSIDGTFVSLGSGRFGVIGRAGPEPAEFVELIQNGSFDSGDFTGWTATSNGLSELTPWTVGPAGGGFLFNSSPLDGTYSAFNGFDGEAGLEYELYQDVAVPANIYGPTLRTNHRIVYTGLGTGGQSRRLEISVRGTGNNLLETLYTETVAPGIQPETDRGWNQQVFDLSSYVGQTVRIHFRELIPNTYPGPALVEFDQISLAFAERTLDEPEVDEYTLDLTGMAGRPISVILADQDGADFSAEVLELLDTDAATVLATAVPDPLGPAATNYDLAILGFVVPADGIYTLRLSSSTGGEYGIVVTDAVIFDTEPNDETTDALQSLGAARTALGYLGDPELGGDWYSISLAAGDPLLVFTQTPFDDPAGSPPNDLDPQLVILAPDGQQVASDTDSAADGKNARVAFTAPETGAYLIRVAAESGRGEYLLQANPAADLPPQAGDDSYVVDEDSTLSVAVPGVLGNDAGMYLAPLTAVLVDGPAHGTLTLNPDGSFDYVPDHNYYGPDSFTYQANDAERDSNVATVTISVDRAYDGSISGTVFEDLDGDGVRDPGEPGLPGWTIELGQIRGDGGLVQTLLSPMPDYAFGWSVALVGNNMLIGAYWFDDATGEVSRILPGFGSSVAAVGDNALVGTPYDDTGARDAGAAYLFNGFSGELLHTFLSPTPERDDEFGHSVAGVGGNVLVGAPDDDTGAKNAGAAYLFHGLTGNLLHTFLNPSPDANDHFGWSVAGVGDNILIGAPGDDTGATDAGAAYLFDGATGELLGTFLNPTAQWGDNFGHSVASMGNDILVGAPNDSTAMSNAGAVYLFDGSTGDLLRTFVSPLGLPGAFGWSIATVGSHVVIGAPTEGAHAGAAYLFDALTGNVLKAFRKPTSPATDHFGWSVTAAGNRIAIGAPYDDTAFRFAGAVYEFEGVPEWSSIVTGADGSYSFAALKPGTYAVREVAQPGHVQTSPGGDGTYTVTVVHDDGFPGLDFGNQQANVVGRHVFYNNSAFDGNDPLADARDDDAIATDKMALLPGQTASSLRANNAANYTSYTRGINGIMVDIAGAAGTPTAADFKFKVGNDDRPENWAPVAGTPTVTVRAGAGDGNSDRVTIIFPDNEIKQQWLEVTVLASENTGLSENDVFYFGNAVAEVGNSASDAIVNVQDILLTRANSHSFWDPAPLDDPYDFDRDRRVNATDILIARANQTWSMTALELIDLSGGKAAGDRASVRDAAMEQAAGRASSGREASSAKMAWLYEFEQPNTKQRAAESGNSVENAVDALLAGDSL